MMGGHASPESVRVVAEMGLDLADHETQPLTEPLVRHADVIYVMSRAHRESLLAQWPSAADPDAAAMYGRFRSMRSDRRAAGALPALRVANPVRIGVPRGRVGVLA